MAIRLVTALRGHRDWLCNTYAQPVELDIASSYFNPEGFGLLVHLAARAFWLRLRAICG